MKLVRTGCTRSVLLIGRYAIKVPNFLDGWKLGLTGLLANIQEVQFSKAKLDGLCPVLFSLPGGWLLVMPRVREMTDREFLDFNAAAFCERGDYLIPAEQKANSFGWLSGSVVAIDYGN